MARCLTEVGRWRRRWAASGTFILVLTAVSGCVATVVEVDPSRLPNMTPTCVVTELSAAAPIIHEVRVTASHEVVVTDGQVEFSDQTGGSAKEPGIAWTKLKVAAVDDVVRWIPAEVKRSFSTGEGPGLKQVNEVVSRLGAEDGAFVGYAAVQPVQVDFTGTCADGDSIAGMLVSWTAPEVGVVKCAGGLDAGATAGARLARKQHGGKF